MSRQLAAELPDFPWDTLEPFKKVAQAHPEGIVDLSVGTPVDPTPAVVREALAAAADAPGYPQTWGTPDLREAVAGWFARRRGVPDVDPDGVLPTIGSKELVAWLPTLLGLGADDVVGIPAVAYPTYDVGARLARATPGGRRRPRGLRPADHGHPPKLLWLNSPSNPTGAVLGAAHLAKVVAWARANGVVVASDECYAELGWSDAPVPSILDPQVCGGSHEGLLAVYSLSKQSNLAGYRAAFVAGDAALVRRLLEVRKHAGMIVPWPVQRAMVAALGDDAHVAEQKQRYAAPTGLAAGDVGAGRVPDRRVRGRALPVVDQGRGRVGERRVAGRPRRARGAGHVLRRGGRPARPGGADGDRRARRRGGFPLVRF